MDKIIVILGPTGSGKSEMAISLSKFIGKGEVISADSKQVYKETDIGTNKIKNEKGIPHHLISFVSPKDIFTVADFKREAKKKIKEIEERGNIPIICGGTWFYIKAIIEDMKAPAVPPDWEFRKEMEKKDTKELFSLLLKEDKRRALEIDKDNKRRIIRALEIKKKTGKPVPPLKKSPFSGLLLGIEVDNKELENRIEKRTDEMIKEGLKEEALKVLRKYNKVPRETIGYKEWEGFLKGELTEKEVRDLIVLHTKRYAREQVRWFKKEKDIIWVKNISQAKEEIKKGSFLASL